MSEAEHTEPEPDEREESVDDLDVPEGQQEGVAGGGEWEAVTLEQGKSVASVGV
jgi:hypothetical protein